MRITIVLSCLILMLSGCAPSVARTSRGERPETRTVALIDVRKQDVALLIYEGWSEPGYIGPELLKQIQTKILPGGLPWGTHISSDYRLGSFSAVHESLYQQRHHLTWRAVLGLEDRNMEQWPGAWLSMYRSASGLGTRVEIRLEWDAGNRESFHKANDAARELLSLMESVTKIDPDSAYLIYPRRSIHDTLGVPDSQDYAMFRESFEHVVFPSVLPGEGYLAQRLTAP